MPEDRHGRLGARKALAARTAVMEAIEPFRAAFGTAGEPDLPGLLLNAGLVHADRGWNSGDDELLSAFLANTVAAVSSACDDAPRSLDDLLREVQAALELAVAERDCHRCTGREERACDGGDLDDVYVEQQGLCLRPYRQMSEFALATAEAWYAEHSTLLDGLELPKVQFGTVHRGRGRSFFSLVSFFVGGGTHYAGDSSSHVDLVFRTRDIRWSCYHACLYVLFHECFAHVFQDLHPSPRGREEARQDDYFTEGWMDWVAHAVLGWTMQGFAPNGESREVPWDEGRVLASSLLYHQARSNTKDPALPVEESAAAETGAAGAAATRRLLVARHGRQEGWRRFLRLSFDLNLTQGVREERSRLAEHAYWATLGQGEDLQAALDRYDASLEPLNALE